MSSVSLSMTALSYLTDGPSAPLTNHHKCPKQRRFYSSATLLSTKKKNQNSSNVKSQPFFSLNSLILIFANYHSLWQTFFFPPPWRWYDSPPSLSFRPNLSPLLRNDRNCFFAIYGHSHISLWLLLDSPADKQLAKPFTFYIGFTRSKSSSLARERPSMLKSPVFSGHHSVVKQLKVNWKPFHLPAFVRWNLLTVCWDLQAVNSHQLPWLTRGRWDECLSEKWLIL